MTTATPRFRIRRTAAAGAALTVLALAAGCSAGGDSADDSAGGSDASLVESAGGSTAQRDAGLAVEADQGGDVASVAEAPAEAPADASAGQDQKVISNGSVQLKSEDVGQALFDVRKVVSTYSGEVESSTTDTDDKGEPLRAMLSIRVPTAQFDAAKEELEKVGTLISSTGDTKDVTTEVLDRDIRIDVQRRSIDRIALLLDGATSLRDIVSIEAQLSQRQADLAVLESEQRYLADQTAMATINVSVERTKEKKKDPVATAKDDDSGFLAGLSTGWDGLTTFGTGLATVLGALLPWMVVAAVLAIPGVPIYRRLRRRPGTQGMPAQTSAQTT